VLQLARQQQLSFLVARAQYQILLARRTSALLGRYASTTNAVRFHACFLTLVPICPSGKPWHLLGSAHILVFELLLTSHALTGFHYQGSVHMFAGCQQPLSAGSSCAEGCQCQIIGQDDRIINLPCPSSNICAAIALASWHHFDLLCRHCSHSVHATPFCASVHEPSIRRLCRPISKLPVTLASSGRGMYPRMPMRHLWRQSTICNLLCWRR
jgi:hypothetical protein